ncbi:hypothetical protein B0J15DRAFT_5739 [Fusarium solani]|jgi:hypothetical protein|uniref:Uncharacterized protein n=1 Tax=Fusarium solani TaxID=169388 RepID=A0A9P9L6N3_FUSSL|nr:uncharacterized protein B0J15DRAFT_5739 [Fusarium solani]KAH7275203.1 hypothetical protein B0J15DRAFT_5739 [Fusarium solani]
MPHVVMGLAALVASAWIVSKELVHRLQSRETLGALIAAQSILSTFLSAGWPRVVRSDCGYCHPGMVRGICVVFHDRSLVGFPGCWHMAKYFVLRVAGKGLNETGRRTLHI